MELCTSLGRRSAMYQACAHCNAQHGLAEVRGLYRGVGGAAAAAGIIIGTYFAFYSSAKNFLRRRGGMHEGAPAGAALLRPPTCTGFSKPSATSLRLVLRASHCSCTSLTRHAPACPRSVMNCRGREAGACSTACQPS